MFKHICLTACLLATACVSAPQGYDSAKWRQDHRECSAQAARDGQAERDQERADTPGYKLPGARAIDFFLQDTVASLLATAPAACMTARGYPAEK